MSTTLTIELPVHFHRCGHGSRKALRSGTEAPALPPGRVPARGPADGLGVAFR